MPNSLFITGATGFLGSRLLEALDCSAFARVDLLVRDDSARRTALPARIREAEIVSIVPGDLASPDRYLDALDASTIVVHAAAMTGASAPEAYQAINVEGTRSLLEACKARGVTRILHISTIAVLYPDLVDYPYGQTKKEAEALVRESGLDYTIVRPTVIADAASPDLQGLVTLAAAPLLIQPGHCRVELRPINLEDLVAALVGLIEEDRFRGETFVSAQ